ncbi:MAG: leucine-rich repeat domain-containing protein [Ruminococcus sp.]|nr:leucine-rich repeat domain-containing protein [Ruminococcus sp.]
MPDGLKYIGDYAFAFCFDLTAVTISDNVKSIGIYAFDYCLHLTYLKIPDNIEYISNYSFSNCPNLIYIYFKCLNEYVDNCFPARYEREYEWKIKGLCLHCGGAFSIFGKCKSCGQNKDY